MAQIAKSVAAVPVEAERSSLVLIIWEGLANGDEGEPVRYAEYADRSVQIIGNLGGGTLTMQGSNDLDAPTNWFTLTDTIEDGIIKTGAAGEQILQACIWIRPILGGGAAGDVDVKLFARRGRGRTL